MNLNHCLFRFSIPSCFLSQPTFSQAFFSQAFFSQAFFSQAFFSLALLSPAVLLAADPPAPPAPLSELPPNAKPGECYARVLQPAKFKSIEERVLVKPEAIRYEIVPAEFKDIEKEIVVRPEIVTYEIVPAQFEKKEIEIVVTPDHRKYSATEPMFTAETVTLELKPSRTQWKFGANPLDIKDQIVGDILCLINEPAETKTYDRHLIAQRANLVDEKVAAATERVVTEVLVKPAEVKEVKAPAVVMKKTVRELVRPASKKEVKVPAEYATITRQVLVEAEKVTWQRVLCATNVTPELLKKLQSTLKEKGFDAGEATGELNDATRAAVKAYQNKNQLAEGGLTYEFLDHIGVRP